MQASLKWAHAMALGAALGLAPGALTAAHAASPQLQLKRAATIAFLMPDQASTRYVTYDIPDFKKDMKQLCPLCTVIAADANGDANLQRTQAEAAIAKNAIAIVVDPVDAAAARGWVQQAMARGVKVIAYDRPFAQMKVDYYVSFNNETVGRMLAEPMIEHLKSANMLAGGKGILIVNGSPTDAAAMLIKKGIHDAVDPSGIKVLAEYDTPDWEPSKARAWVGSQISRFGDKIAAVIAANDGTGTAAAAALEAGGLKPVPPVTGNDATLAGVQLVLLRRMWDTISKPGATEAWAAANAVVALVQNKKVPLLEGGKEVTLFDTPSQLFKPTVIMPENIQKDIVDMGFLKASDICTAPYATACEKYGVK
ncbi:MAG: substrate-binding domain-containing protein [Gammaproteobacteria bacterium]